MEENKAGGGVVLSAGMAEFGPEDRSVHDVFSRADERMYERKKILKG
jgi:GGDEF domain-containing protein